MLIGSTYPSLRPRRLRQSAILRRMLSETRLTADQLILPFFVRSGNQLKHPVNSMPGVYQLSPDELIKEVELAWKEGVRAIILFGIPDLKDSKASGAYASDGIVPVSIRLLKKHFPELIILADVCLCEYMDHGHCGLVKEINGKSIILNDESLPLLAQSALVYAQAGADIVAPSDMMDGRVRAIRESLDQAGLTQTPILSYAAKYASAYYGPFREAAESAPKFGDRRSYQMGSANGAEALREVALDIQEGADMVMVKPALAYLDIIERVKTTFQYPTVAYSVSGEYSMIKAAAAQGWIDENAITMETLLAIRRAGADLIITYSALLASRLIRQNGGFWP